MEGGWSGVGGWGGSNNNNNNDSKKYNKRNGSRLTIAVEPGRRLWQLLDFSRVVQPRPEKGPPNRRSSADAPILILMYVMEIKNDSLNDIFLFRTIVGPPTMAPFEMAGNARERKEEAFTSAVASFFFFCIVAGKI